MNEQIRRANNWRRNIVSSLETTSEVSLGIYADLRLEASRPTSIGFSPHDLEYYKSYYAERHARVKSKWSYLNKKYNSSPNPRLKADRDNMYRFTLEARNVVTTLQEEISRREEAQQVPVANSITRAQAIKIAGDEESLEMALLFAQKMGTNVVLDTKEGVLKLTPAGYVMKEY